MIMKPRMMKISEKSNRSLLIDRFYPRHRLTKDRPMLISRMTPDVQIWIRKGWIIPVAEEKEKEKKKVKVR